MPDEGQQSTQFHRHPVSKLGEYKVIKDIAEGTFGKVKMAKHVITDQIVAMKYLSKDAILASGTKTRVLREVQYMRMLKHPHIVKLYEVISTPTHIILVLEFVEGELFNYIVKHGEMPESQARRFFQQLISGIHHSHRLRVVHRDLKPENVLLDDQLNVKIADFGLSNVVTDGEFLHTSCGSPNYAAPEVIRGLRYTGPEIDVWSCGVILYVMLCGRLPFEDDDVNMLFAKIAQGVYYVPQHLSTEAKSLLARMLTVDPVKRITVPEIMDSTFYRIDLPRYLIPLPPSVEPVIESLSSLVKPPKTLDFEFIEGIGRINNDVVQQIADTMENTTVKDILDALRVDDGVAGNAVKVAYQLLRDKKRAGKDLAMFENEELDARLAVMDPLNKYSLPRTPGADSNREDYFEDGDDANDDDDDYDEETEEEGEELQNDLDWEPLQQQSHIAVLPTSIPGHPCMKECTSHSSHQQPLSAKEKKSRKSKWHFGIRSRSPRLEVMLEIYRTLQSLGMEWKEKKYLGGLGGVRTSAEIERLKIHRRSDLDGESLGDGVVDMKTASSVYFVETRSRTDDVVTLMDLQLYQLDDDNYLVDFKHQGYYRASKAPGARKFDRAPSPPPSSVSSHSSVYASEKEYRRWDIDDVDNTVSPFLFMDTACRLILELAGGGDS
ncbi:hypothetical protein Clacol_007462 [Clathrus columnatus]|uniref:non-specific serine/threonine protein kinase n=1 Tax=Clathrus columnatus TaxID=1419009 RepID=A0AAV5AJU5_9AGAM|nr:hypothetical protein Clacol_007462 [Clathrus columnatus]